jgi:formyltetrahydrofolate deformylase
MDLIASLQCADQPGIVHAMTSAVLACGGNIIENQQFTDEPTNTFVMRTRFETTQGLDAAKKSLSEGLSKFSPALHIRPTEQKPRALVLVTKESHCLRDLLYLLELGELPIEIPVVVSNHEDLRSLVESHGFTFVHLPVTSSTKVAQEKELLVLIEKHAIDFVVLARYMQILSNEFCAALPGRIINIHHSFLPGFKGANPYAQAHARGVKLIGATAHFVTEDLDEGPIIEQNVTRVEHSESKQQLVQIGQDAESKTLTQAVKWFAEHRVLLDGQRTIIFR